MNKRWWILMAAAGAALTVGVALSVVVAMLPDPDAEVKRAYIQAQRLLDQGRAEEAVAVIARFGEPEGGERDWVGLDVRASAAARSFGRMEWLGIRHPDRVAAHEPASLIASRLALEADEPGRAQRWAQRWAPDTDRHPEADPALASAWLGIHIQIDRALGAEDQIPLRIDRAVASGQPRLAAQGHLIRALATNRDVDQAGQHLDAGIAQAPDYAELRVFRGNLAESRGDLGQAASEYSAAVVAEPGNPLWKDNLAEFHRRQGRLPQAVAVWGQALEAGAPSYLWIKHRFWGLVGDGHTDRAELGGARVDGNHLVASFLHQLPAECFWDEAAWVQIPGHVQAERRRPEILWLRVMEALRLGDEATARAQLTLATDSHRAIDPVLTDKLIRSLDWRAGWDGDISQVPEALTWLTTPAWSALLLDDHGWDGAALLVGAS